MSKKKKIKVKKKLKLKKPVKKPLLKKKARSASTKPGKTLVGESTVMELIEKGRHRGFVTQTEILNMFPNIEKDITGLEGLYERLEASNINIIESGRVFEEEKQKEYDEKKKIQDEFGEGSSSDSVQMYLKEIGQYPLLSSEEEIDLAKRIEKNDESARQKLALSNLRL